MNFVYDSAKMCPAVKLLEIYENELQLWQVNLPAIIIYVAIYIYHQSINQVSTQTSWVICNVLCQARAWDESGQSVDSV